MTGHLSESIQRLDVAAALSAFNTRAGGLSREEAEIRRREFGPNSLARAPHRRPIAQFLAQLTHFFALILWTGAGLAAIAEVLSPGSGMDTLAEAIVAVILVNAVFSFWQERRAHRAIEALQRLLPSVVRIRRDGAIVEVAAPALVPGDVVALAEGDHVPADCRLLEAFGVKVDNATLTGESTPQSRDARPDLETSDRDRAHQRNMVLAGTSIVAGEAVALVVATGMSTEFGHIAHLTEVVPERTAPLQHEIARLSHLVALLSVLLGIVLFVVGRLVGLPIWDNFVFAIGVIVANVPEGLLPTLTLAMAMGAQRMAGRKTLVRHLPAVEALGSATVICTDKTGTLTENRMEARRLFASGQLQDLRAATQESDFIVRHRRLFAAALNCESVRVGHNHELHGDPMEVALVQMGRRALPECAPLPRLDFLPFDAERMRVASLHPDESGFVLYAKGALQTILPRCTSTEEADGVESLAFFSRSPSSGSSATRRACSSSPTAPRRSGRSRSTSRRCRSTSSRSPGTRSTDRRASAPSTCGARTRASGSRR